MSYIQRSARDSLETLSHMFGAVLVTGARQVGKSTLLEHLTSATNKVSIHTMDDANTLEAARTDPGTFLALNPPPLLLDEIQKAPSLFPFIKMEIDRSRGKGLYFMSGSEQFSMMEQVSESLAGRIGILTLMGISLREELIWKAQEQAETLVGQSESFLSREALRFIPTDEALKERAPSIPKLDVDDLWRILHRGSMPELVCHPQYDWSMFYGSYVQTYIERDVRRLTQVDDEIQFQTFMRVIAARTGQMLNISEVAQEVGIRDAKAKKWLSVLQASHLVYLLKPFYTNHTKRAIKTPKLYMTDTGLAAYLTRWSNHRVLQEGALSGAFFETFVIGEVLKCLKATTTQENLTRHFTITETRTREKSTCSLCRETLCILWR